MYIYACPIAPYLVMNGLEFLALWTQSVAESEIGTL